MSADTDEPSPTIVGGQPGGKRDTRTGIPKGIESVLALAATDLRFRQRFAQDRAAALREAGIELNEQERTLLAAISDRELVAMAGRLEAKARISTRRLAAAAVTVAALGGVAILALPNTLGIRPDAVHERPKEILEGQETEKSGGAFQHDMSSPGGSMTPTPTPLPSGETGAPPGKGG